MKLSLETIQVELITRGYDVDLVFDPVVESYINTILEDGKWQVAKQFMAKAVGMGAKEAQAAKAVLTPAQRSAKLAKMGYVNKMARPAAAAPVAQNLRGAQAGKVANAEFIKGAQ